MQKEKNMRRFMKIVCLLVLVVCLDARLTQADDSIGTIKKLNGTATFVRDKTELKVKLGDPVFMKDVLKTDNTGSLGVTFKDNSMISVGPNTVYTIDEYVFKPSEQKLAFVSNISKGTLHFVSGSLTKMAPDAVKVKTPEGTIGFRGTRCLVKVENN
jgi:hypothetical protein